MQPSRTISVSIARSPRDVYEFVRDPHNLPRWATAFCLSVVEGESEHEYLVETAAGPMTLRFVPENELGVLDHYVTVTPGVELANPMRVVPNGEGSEVLFTLFQSPQMSDEQFVEDAGLVQRDLQALKALLERAPH